MKGEKALIGTSAAARMLGYSERTIRQFHKTGRLPGFRTASGHRRFLVSDVRVLLTTTPPEDKDGGERNDGMLP